MAPKKKEQKKERDTPIFLKLNRKQPRFMERPQPDKYIRSYLEYYRLPTDPAGFWFGYIPVGKESCAAQLYLPEGEARGTIVIVHGFLSHFGFFQDLVPLLLEENWAVAGIDLPGHGISSGTPTAIENFAQYGQAVSALINTIDPLAPRPVRAIGHSMGCASLLEYRRAGGSLPEEYIFVAPLVRSTMYGLTQFGFSLMQPFVADLPRLYQKTSSDAAYLEFKEFHDPLQSDRIDPSWVRALFTWNEEIEESELPPMQLAIIQGDQDRVVDFKYNLGFFRKRLEAPETYMIPGGRHELPKESPLYQQEFFTLIKSLLDGEE